MSCYFNENSFDGNLGAPGSGKTVQATMVSLKLGLEHVSIGNLLRKHVANTDNKDLRQQLDKGEIVSYVRSYFYLVMVILHVYDIFRRWC